MSESPIRGFVDRSVMPPIRRSMARASTPEGALRESLTIIAYLALVYGFWLYSNKFLGMSADYITSMSRDIPVLGKQANLSFYPMDKMMLFYGGTILMCFLLIQNEFRAMAKAIGRIPRYIRREEQEDFDWSTISTSIFGIVAYLICYYVMVHAGMDFKAGTQVPFIFLGGALVAGVLLLQNNIHEVLSSFTRPVLFQANKIKQRILGSTDDSEGATEAVRADRIDPITGVKVSEYEEESNKGSLKFLLLSLRDYILRPEGFGILVSLSSILLFVYFTMNMQLFPFITDDIPAFLSAVTLFVAISWTLLLSREGAKPSVQSKRTAALAFFVFFPFISYLFLRLIFLQNDGTSPTMLNRWEVRFDFMEKVNTFRINPWPMEAEPNQDSRWVFLKAGIINSARVTLVSIFLCTVFGVIVGVTRLSTNKLASMAATVYVEVFRNLPLAVLLFLISSQMGAQLPFFIDEYSIGELSESDTGSEAAVYISNEGTWFVNFGSYFHVMIGVAILMLLRVLLRFQDRVEPREASSPSGLGLARRPFSPLGWRNEPLAADIFLIISLFLCVSTMMPFLSTEKVEDAQSIGQIASSFLTSLGAIALVIYAFFVNTNIDDDGMNNLEIDDTDAGIRRRFTIWVAAMSVAMGIAIAGGVSWPEYSRDIYEPFGTIDPPGSWDIVEGTGFEMTPSFLAMMLGLTLFTTSVVAEIVRGSIQSLPRGQVEAAISLSLNPYQRLRLVILPQALRSMVPLLNNQYMNVWKNSSLAVVVAYTDIFYVILVMMNNVGKLVPLFLLLLITYQAGSLTISAIMNWYNSRVTSVKI